MQPRPSLRLLLVVSGVLAMGIGAAILFSPAAFHAANGIEIGADPNLRSEVRAPGGALVALGGLILAGAFMRSLTFASAVVSATVYLAYGVSRLFSIAVDGMPTTAIVGATVIELLIGGASAAALGRSSARGASTVRATGRRWGSA